MSKRISRVYGVDPGVNTGIAIKHDSELVSVDSTHHNCAFEYIETDIALSPNCDIKIIIEDARLRKWFGHNSHAKLQGAGAIKVICSLWSEWSKIFNDNNRIKVIFQTPIKGGTKLNRLEFKELTGWDKTTNNHSRDAGVIAHYG